MDPLVPRLIFPDPQSAEPPVSYFIQLKRLLPIEVVREESVPKHLFSPFFPTSVTLEKQQETPLADLPLQSPAVTGSLVAWHELIRTFCSAETLILSQVMVRGLDMKAGAKTVPIGEQLVVVIFNMEKEVLQQDNFSSEFE